MVTTMSGSKEEEFSCHCGQTLYGFRSYRAHLPFCSSNTGNTTAEKIGIIRDETPKVDAIPTVTNKDHSSITPQPFANLFDVMMNGADGEPESNERNNDNFPADVNSDDEVEGLVDVEESIGDDWGITL